MTPQQVLALCREKDVKAVDLRFVDLLGIWQHFTIPVSALNEDAFDNGLGFDGAGLGGWKSSHEPDLLVIPQPETAFIDPIARLCTLVMIGVIQDPIAREDYSKDPRTVATKAVSYLKNTGVADSILIAAELEFFVFDDAKFATSPYQSYYSLHGGEAAWNREGSPQPDPARPIPQKGEAFALTSQDQLCDLRDEMMQALIESGITVQAHRHAAATAGQCKFDLSLAPLVKMADQILIFKSIVKSVARRAGKTATFMPKPLFGKHGSGMHTHFSLWKDSRPLFAGGGYAGLSDMAVYAIGGILRHAGALLAFTNPTTNSYKRLLPRSGAPVNLTYSQHNGSACCRIPMYSASPKTKRVEFRCPDASSNPYLAFSAIVLAAMDGIQTKIHPGAPLDQDLNELSLEERANVPQTPASLDESLAALERDHDFLLRGDVFSQEFLKTWIEYKRQHEIEPLRSRTHPHEFCMYYDV